MLTANLLSPRRLATSASLLVIVPVGFAGKFYRGPAQAWVNDSLGGLFYVVFWCLVAFWLWPRTRRPGGIALGVLAGTCGLEFLQLWHPHWLQLLRASFLGATILGTTFAGSDFPYYFAGAALGWLWLRGLRRLQA